MDNTENEYFSYPVNSVEQNKSKQFNFDIEKIASIIEKLNIDSFLHPNKITHDSPILKKTSTLHMEKIINKHNDTIKNIRHL